MCYPFYITSVCVLSSFINYKFLKDKGLGIFSVFPQLSPGEHLEQHQKNSRTLSLFTSSSYVSDVKVQMSNALLILTEEPKIKTLHTC